MNNSPTMLRRFGAIFYDCLLCIACLFVFVGIIVTLNKGQEATVSQQPFVNIGMLLIVFFYFVGFWRQGGQTPGMKVWKITLVSNEPPASMFKLMIRFFVVLLTLGGSLILGMFNNGICLHDRLSRTSLINK